MLIKVKLFNKIFKYRIYKKIITKFKLIKNYRKNCFKFIIGKEYAIKN